MISSLFRFIAPLIAWASIYPLTLLAIVLLGSSAKQELLWQLQFESHYLLARQLVVDYLSTLQFTVLWLAALILYRILSNKNSRKTATWIFVLYPFTLAAILHIFSMPDIFWQMAIVGGLLNLLFIGNKK